jgi:hypothetical protein
MNGCKKVAQRCSILLKIPTAMGGAMLQQSRFLQEFSKIFPQQSSTMLMDHQQTKKQAKEMKNSMKSLREFLR